MKSQKQDNPQFKIHSIIDRYPVDDLNLFRDAAALFEFSPQSFEQFDEKFDVLLKVCEFRVETEKRENPPQGADMETFEHYYDLSKQEDPKQYMSARKAGVIPDRLKNKILGVKRNEQPVDSFNRQVKEMLNKYSMNQFELMRKSAAELLDGLKLADFEECLTGMLVQLYDKAALEHKFINLYGRLIHYVVLQHKHAHSVSALDVFEKTVKANIAKEIETYKTPLSQYRPPPKADPQAIMQFNSNYDLHFKGCALLIAQLYLLSSNLCSKDFVTDSLVKVLLRDLRKDTQDKLVLSKLAAATEATFEGVKADIVKTLLSKTTREKSEYLVLSILIFDQVNKAVHKDSPELMSRLRIEAYRAYIQQLNTDIVDSLVIYKIKCCLDTSVDTKVVQSNRQKISMEKQPFSEILQIWNTCGLLHVVKGMLNVSTDEQIVDRIENSQCFAVFIQKVFENNQQAKLLKDKFQLLQKIKCSKGAEKYVLEQILTAFADSYNSTNSNEALFDMAIDFCLKTEFYVYSLFNAANSREFIFSFIHFVIAKAYLQVFEEYDGVFSDSEVEAAKRDIANKSYFAIHGMTDIYKIFAQQSYSYFNQPDFPAFASKCTTKFEDDAIAFFEVIFVGKTGFQDKQKGILAEKMKELVQLFSAWDDIKSVVGLFKMIFQESQFSIGFCAFDMFGYNNHASLGARAYFYAQRKLLIDIEKQDKMLDFNNSLKENQPPIKSYFPSIALFVLESVYEITKNCQNSQQKMLYLLNSLNKVGGFNKAAANALILKMNSKNEKWGIYKLQEFK
uniref:Uncharacterized protein n=1 Tax=Spironucleus salmonicida TaxID=348837 RepID=V6M4G9_9EUKA|eukprot:EST48214.1 Hypothetical protein SS50377_11655 [Spironucleus salmonicida]